MSTVRTSETSHFWVGRFPTEQDVADYFRETRDENVESPFSAFARDQRETWYDHDFLECGFRAGVSTIEQLVAGHSYHEQWASELALRAKDAGLTDFNMFAFINREQFAQPQSVSGDAYWLRYLGTINYRI